jgi:hypothetical protein
MQLIINGSRSSPIQKNVGLFQGSLLAPFLWNIYIDDLLDTLLTLSPSSSTHIPHLPALLFADDIKLQCIDTINANQLLAAVDTWALHNHAVINPQKSNVVGWPKLEAGELRSHFGLIEQKDSYVYLGAPMGAKGIMWKEWLSSLMGKGRRMLDFVISVGIGWPEWVRVVIYKTFVRTRMEYGLALIWAWVERDKGKRVGLLKPLEEIQDRAIRWIFGKKHSQKLSLHRNLAGLLPVILRTQHLKTRFFAHLQRLHRCNPLSSLHTSITNNIMFATTSILFSFKPKMDMLYKQYQAAAKTHSQQKPQEPPLKLSNFLKKQHYEHLSTEIPSAKYIPKKSRKGNSLWDGTLFILDNDLRRRAFTWRSSTMGVWKTEAGKSWRGKCAECGQDMSRRHVRGCILVEGTVGLEDLEVLFALELGDFWTVLDLYLNDGRWEDFKKWSDVVMGKVVWEAQRQRGR